MFPIGGRKPTPDELTSERVTAELTAAALVLGVAIVACIILFF